MFLAIVAPALDLFFQPLKRSKNESGSFPAYRLYSRVDKIVIIFFHLHTMATVLL